MTSLKKIGLLDFGFRFGIEQSAARINSVVEEAVFLEKLGFSRIWYTEHFGDNSHYIWSSPDMLIPVIACYTNRINIGIAGTAIRYHSPIKIAKDYTLLSEAFGERIDLGFSKGVYAGLNMDLMTFPNTKGIPREDLDERIRNTAQLIYAYRQIPIPTLWNLTGSQFGYEKSLLMGVNCCRSLFHINSSQVPGNAEQSRYRDNFKELYGFKPQSTISVAGTIQTNKNLIDEIIEQHINRDVENFVCGNQAQVRDQLMEYAKIFDVEEIIFYELSFEQKHRNKSLKALGNIINLL